MKPNRDKISVRKVRNDRHGLCHYTCVNCGAYAKLYPTTLEARTFLRTHDRCGQAHRRNDARFF